MTEDAKLYTQKDLDKARSSGGTAEFINGCLAAAAVGGILTLVFTLNATKHVIKRDQNTTVVFQDFGVVNINGETYDFVTRTMTPKVSNERYGAQPIDFSRMNPAEIVRVAELARTSLNIYLKDFKANNPGDNIPNWLVGSHMYFTGNLPVQPAQAVPGLD